MNRILPLAAVLALGACTASQQASFNKAVVAGQAYCAKATADGPLVVALADALGAPIIVTGEAAAVVAAQCAAIGAVPVMPPANPAAAPMVAAPLTPAK